MPVKRQDSCSLLPAQFDEAAYQARVRQVIRVVACDRENPNDAFIKFEGSRNSEDPASNEDLMIFLMAKAKQALWGGCVPDSPTGPRIARLA